MSIFLYALLILIFVVWGTYKYIVVDVGWAICVLNPTTSSLAGGQEGLRLSAGISRATLINRVRALIVKQ